MTSRDFLWACFISSWLLVFLGFCPRTIHITFDQPIELKQPLKVDLTDAAKVTAKALENPMPVKPKKAKP